MNTDQLERKEAAVRVLSRLQIFRLSQKRSERNVMML